MFNMVLVFEILLMEVDGRRSREEKYKWNWTVSNQLKEQSRRVKAVQYYVENLGIQIREQSKNAAIGTKWESEHLHIDKEVNKAINK